MTDDQKTIARDARQQKVLDIAAELRETVNAVSAQIIYIHGAEDKGTDPDLGINQAYDAAEAILLAQAARLVDLQGASNARKKVVF